MDEDDAGRTPVGSGGPMSERMQALLSRAAEEQLTEQRQVSLVLTDLRQLVTGLGEQLRGAASAARLDGLGDEVAVLLTELRTSTSGLGDRLDALDRRVDTGLADLTARTGVMESMRGDLTAVLARAGELASGAALTRAQDALASRLDQLEAGGGAVLERLTGLDGRLEVLEQRLGAVAERLVDVGDAAGGVPSVAIDVARLVGKLDGLTGLSSEVAGLREDVEGLSAHVGSVSVPSADAVAAAVSGSVTTSIQDGLVERVRAATTDSEQRISAHVDEAVLALAEALLRRRRDTRADVLAAVAPEGAG